MKKKFCLAFVTLAALLCLYATSAFAVSVGYTTTNGDVNMRTGPGMDYARIMVIPAGASVYVESVDNSGWSYVSYGGNEGFVANKYLGAAPAPATAPAASTPAYSGNANYGQYAVSDYVNLRSGPGTNYAVLTVVPAGAYISVSDYSYGWAHAWYGGYEGYVYTQYIPALSGYTYTAPASSGTINIGTSGNYGGYGYTTGTTWYGGCNYANVYDYNYYYSHHKDVVNAVGGSPEALIQHFVNYGMSEGRQAIGSFNVYTYRDSHPDLQQRFGNDLRSYYLYACGLI